MLKVIERERERERERGRKRLVNILKYVTKGTRSMGPGNRRCKNDNNQNNNNYNNKNNK